MKLSQTISIVCLLLLSVCAVVVLSNPTVAAPPPKVPSVKKKIVLKKAADTYKPDQYCYNKCVKYSSIKGQCTDYNWEGTTKKCDQYKTVGKGKCLEYKRETTCKKYSKGPTTICVAHGSRQECAKKKYFTTCTREEYKKSCTHQGSNGKCLAWAHRDICMDNYKPGDQTTLDPYARCALWSYIPKLNCNYKRRCVHQKVDNYCKKYGQKCEKKCKWEEVKQSDLYVPHNANANSKSSASNKKGAVDPYAPPKVFRHVCHKKCHQVCDEYAKKLSCEKYDDVKFCKTNGYIKFCAQPEKTDSYTQKPAAAGKTDAYLPPKCKNLKRVKYCTRWTKEKQCDQFKKVRCCLQKKRIAYCDSYKSVPYCTQHETIPKRCIKQHTVKKCINYSKGQQVCTKYSFAGGKATCKHFAQKTVCKYRKRVCSSVKEDHADTIDEKSHPAPSKQKPATNQSAPVNKH